MWHSSLVSRLAVVVTACMVATACGGSGVMSSVVTCGGGPGSGGPPGPTPGPTGVAGAVTNSRGGAAVSGATISATNTSATAMTNGQGAYTLALSPGTYDITATATGMAASKLQSVVVTNGQTTTANLIMFPVFNSTKPISAPTIAVTGLSQGQMVAGQVSFTVTVTAANPVLRIDLRASNLNALAQTSVADASSATFSLNTCVLTNGPGFVDIITYDLNQNSAEMIVGFTVTNGVGGSPPATPTGLLVVSVTTGQSLGLFRTQRAQLFSAFGVRQDPSILRVGSRSIHLLAAPSTATLFIETLWNSVPGASGYIVRRSSGGQFVQVAQVTSTFYDDADPSLSPGTTFTYQVVAYNPGGNSAATQSLSVIPLPAFNVSLATPANNATGVSTVPTLLWTLPNGAVGTSQFYDFSVQGVNDAIPAWLTTGFAFINPSPASGVAFGSPPTEPGATSLCAGFVSVSACPPLQSGKVYQWDIFEAEGETVDNCCDPNTGLPNSVALAVANGGLFPTVPAGGSLNGPFTFTTAP